MAIRTDITVNQLLSPRLAEITSASNELTAQDSHDTLVRIEDDPWNKSYKGLVSTAGKEDLGGGTQVGLTTTLLDVQYAPSRTAPRSIGAVTTTDTDGLVLTDSAATFQTDGVQRGDWVINFTDQSVTEVLTVDSETQLTCRALSNGTDNQFDIGDAYKVWEVSEFALTGGNFVANNAVGGAINPLFTTFGRFITRTSSSSATLQNQKQLNAGLFGGVVAVNVLGGKPGTGDDENGNPIGTRLAPSDNMSDAKTIADAMGLDTFKIIGNITLTTAIPGYIFNGQNAGISTITVDPGADVTGCEFWYCTLAGTLDGGAIVRDSIVGSVNYLNGILHQTMLVPGTIQIGAGSPAFILNCYSGAPAGINLDMNGANTALLLGYRGPITIKNATSGATLIVDSGNITIDGTNSDLTVYSFQDAHISDSGTNTTIDFDSTHEMIEELWGRMGLDPSNPVTHTKTNTTFGSVTINRTGDGINTSTDTRQ